MKAMSFRDQLTYYVTLLPEVNWITFLFILITPFVAIYGLLTTTFVWQTWVLTYVFGLFGAIAMGSGYHRLYSHRTFKASRPVELWLLFWATTDFSMSAIDWVTDHRAHHKYSETDLDPYNIKKGFWWAHMGWLFWKREMPKTDVSDLKRDPVLVFQHEHFFELALLSGWVIPTLLCGLLWNDWRGGFFIAAVSKTVALHHIIFCINSAAHTFGDANYNDGITPRDSLLLALFTCGEGYHNFHHEFPNDYRNGFHSSAIDLNKWIIYILEQLGLATSLKRTSPDQVKISRLQMIQRKVERESAGIFVGKPLESLPYYSVEEVQEMVQKKGAMLLLKDDLVYDVKSFIGQHPGGKGYLSSYMGKDIGGPFGGGVYAHSNSAQNILQTLRCGRLFRVKSHDA